MTSTFYSQIGKRCLDLAAASLGVVLIAPALAIVAIVLKITSPGPVFFRQIRVGRFGRPFLMFKFRSMKAEGGNASRLTAAGDPRVTRFGAWLRRTKIDELPQLFNVVLGQMSLVGPRPEVPEFTAHYTQAQRAVLNLRPGMTSFNINVCEEELLANRRNKESFYIEAVLPQKLEIDLTYCRHISLRTDLWILLVTFAKLFSRVPKRSKKSPHPVSTPLENHLAQEKDRSLMKRMTLNSSWLYTKPIQIMLDGSAFALAILLAYLVRFDGKVNAAELRGLTLGIPVFVGVRLSIHRLLGIYKQVWKFISFSDVLAIANSVAIASTVLISIRLSLATTRVATFWGHVPISVFLLEGFLALSGGIGVRALRRILYVRQRKAEAAAGNVAAARVFLYGAGRAGIMLRKELDTSSVYEVIGFIDDDPRKVGSNISKTPVVGTGEQLGSLAEKYRIDEVIISMATANRMTLSRTLARCRRAGVPAKIIPSLQELISGQVQISQLRDSRVEEVLGRDSVEVNAFEELAGASYRNKRVLVTGAGGSIGSEAVRQLVRLLPASIALLDIDENAIYELQQELLLNKVDVQIQPAICSVTDIDRLRSVFRSIRPQVIIHAAAHKHVPLMELQPCEAVINNVGGTRNVLELAREVEVERLVFISSDKAVNPVNVMGATKRIGELLVQASSYGSLARSACVRFGNVLGSQGSVIPLFKKQIESGGPVTITHPDMVRYFMTVREAVQLVLCAGTLANEGETFVLDMGKPRNILELAREMILLAGLEPGRDIDTVVVGLRPGEKLYEDLVTSTERLLRTRFEKLSLVEPQKCDAGSLARNVCALLQCAKNDDARGVQHILLHMGLGYSVPNLHLGVLAASSGQFSGTHGASANRSAVG